jgi:CRP-like cAMP-binding protein
MHEVLFKAIGAKVSLTSADEQLIKQYFKPKRLRKRQYLLQDGDVCDRFNFVTRGSMVTRAIDENGHDRVISFAFEGWWVGDLNALYNKVPSRLNVEALEPCDLLQIRCEHHETLMKEIPAYETYTRIKYQNACVALLNRIQGSLGLTAEEKYCRLVKDAPLIAAKVPLTLISAYLGVTPETLSRIRKSKSILTY